MSIPLVQNNEKDSINTSIIAIKRNIERINMLLGLVDNDSPDLSGFATKQELQDAVTELQPVDEVTSGNMHSVTSNAVAVALRTLPKTKIGFVDIRTSTDSSSHTVFSSSELPSNAIPIAVFSRDSNTYVLTNGGLTSSYEVSVMKEKAISGGYGWGLVTEVSCAYTVMYILAELNT